MHIYVKPKIKWGNRHDFFFIFFIENELFAENVNKCVHGNEPNGQTVQPTMLILISIEAELCALHNDRVFFETHFSFRVIHFFSEKWSFA